MTITSFWFFFLIAAGAIVYYAIPRGGQWIWLLVLSLIFYYFSGVFYTILYLIFQTIIAYLSAIIMDLAKKRKGIRAKCITYIAAGAIAINVIIWFAFKGKGFWIYPLKLFRSGGSVLAGRLLDVNLLAALGMSYYTMQILGYIIDCYLDITEPQYNPFKLFLFTAFFPQLTTGPISRYKQLKSLYIPHGFSYRNISFGAQRILWGVMKKIVLAERLNTLVSAISASADAYNGFYSWIVILLYPVQMYIDFSGCMDIVLGAAEVFDIRLPENFNNPLFSRTSQEFWQRWHISLGLWAKDYVLYPLLKSKTMQNFGAQARSRLGRKWGKFLVNSVGMFILWMVIAIWHGKIRYIVGVCLWYWFILMLEDLMTPIAKKINATLCVKEESTGWHLYQSLRTYVVFAIGAAFFNLGVRDGLKLLKSGALVFIKKGIANPWIFFDGSILKIGGLTYGDLNIIIIGLLSLLVVAILRERHGFARTWIEKQSFGFRWFIWIGMFVFVLIWGKYGPEYDATTFIYQGF